jgi:hypothetical protein
MNPTEMIDKLRIADCVVTLYLVDDEINLLVNGDQEKAYDMIKMTAFALKNKQITES